MKKYVYLLRHAKSRWDNENINDKDRGLSERGVFDSQKIAKFLLDNSIQPEIIYTSSARRCLDTLNYSLSIAQFNLSKDLIIVQDRLYGCDVSYLLEIISGLNKDCNSVMIINHEPTIRLLALYLTNRHSNQYRELIYQKYPTGSLAIIEGDCKSWSDIYDGTMRVSNFILPKNLNGLDYIL
tara:strand:+ start:17135 stop:17680 length:546 start_codon:yes stop_codon:yes gene_type:complete